MDAFESELIVSVVQESSYVAVLSPAMTEITIPEGYELVSYTLRSKHDGHLQSYQPVDVQHFHTGPLLATPTETLNIGSSAQRSHQNVQGRLSSDSLTPTPSTISGPYPQQQLFNIPIRGGRERSTATDNAQTVSAHTQKRYNESGENGYTIACGVFSPERAPPVKKVNPKAGDFYCPRCGSNYTRAKTVKDHFPSCVLKYGNPDSLRYNSHESMPSKDAALHSSHRSYRASSSAGVDQADDMTAEDDQVIKNEYVSAAE